MSPPRASRAASEELAVPKGPLFVVQKVTAMRVEKKYGTVEFKTHFSGGDTRWEPPASFVGGIHSELIQGYKEKYPKKYRNCMKKDKTKWWDMKMKKEREEKEAKRAQEKKRIQYLARKILGNVKIQKLKKWEIELYTVEKKSSEEMPEDHIAENKEPGQETP